MDINYGKNNIRYRRNGLRNVRGSCQRRRKKSLCGKKVSSSHSKGQTEIIADQPLDDDELKKAVEETGYKVLGIHTEPFEKKGFALFKK